MLSKGHPIHIVRNTRNTLIINGVNGGKSGNVGNCPSERTVTRPKSGVPSQRTDLRMTGDHLDRQSDPSPDSPILSVIKPRTSRNTKAGGRAGVPGGWRLKSA